MFGPSNKNKFIQVLPEERYDRSESSHIVKLINTLCGDSGVGAVKKWNMIAQLQANLGTTFYDRLDKLYGFTLQFPRNSREIYSISLSKITASQQNICRLKDALYKKRIFKYLIAIQVGATQSGLKLAAEAASGFNCCVIVDDPSTASIETGQVSIIINYDADTSNAVRVESELAVYRHVGRLLPPNVVLNINYTPNNFTDPSIYYEFNDEYDFDVSASSEMYEPKRFIVYDKNEDGAISNGERIEVTKVADYLSQTAIIPLTHMIENAEASSEHFGTYSAKQNMFTSVQNTNVTYASNAICNSNRVRYISSYYSDDAYIDGMYPISYAKSTQTKTDIWWSSIESDNDEHIEFNIPDPNGIPVNHITFLTTNKPCTIKLLGYNNGEWLALKDLNGRDIVIKHDRWGSDQFRRIDIMIANTIVQSIKIEFEKTESFSVEVAQFEILYDIKNSSDLDYINAHSYIDFMGNIIDFEKFTYTSAMAKNHDDNEYWLSSPNASSTCVEYLILDFGSIKPLTTLEIVPIFIGMKCNLYYSNDSENWIPLGPTYTLNGLTIEFIRIHARYIKCEFYNLTALPYTNHFELSDKNYYFPVSVTGDILSHTVASANTNSNEFEYIDNRNDLIKLSTNTTMIGGKSGLTEILEPSGYSEPPMDVAPDIERSQSIVYTGTTVHDIKFIKVGPHIYTEKDEILENDMAYFAAIYSIRAYNRNSTNTTEHNKVFGLGIGDLNVGN